MLIWVFTTGFILGWITKWIIEQIYSQVVPYWAATSLSFFTILILGGIGIAIWKKILKERGKKIASLIIATTIESVGQYNEEHGEDNREN